MVVHFNCYVSFQGLQKLGHIWTCWTMATLLSCSSHWVVINCGQAHQKQSTKMQPTIQVVIDNNFMTWSGGGSGKRFTIDSSVICDPRIVQHPQLHHQRTVTIHSTTTPPQRSPKNTWESKNPNGHTWATKANICQGGGCWKKNTIKTYQWYTYPLVN